MLIKRTFYTLCIEKALQSQYFRRQQIAGPWFERPSQPVVDRNAKGGLGPVDRNRGNMLIKQLPYQPFTSACANLHFGRNPRGEFHDILVQKRNAGFKAD